MLWRYAEEAGHRGEGPCLKHLPNWKVNLAGSPWQGRKASRRWYRDKGGRNEMPC